MGALKNVDKTLCIRVESPGARVGHAWLKVEEMNGSLGGCWIPVSDTSRGGKGIDKGKFGLVIAEVGKGGRPRMSEVIPGTRIVTTFVINEAFSTLSQLGGGASEMMCRARSRISSIPTAWFLLVISEFEYINRG